MDLNAEHALLEQLTESSRRSADALATLAAEMAALRAEVGEIDGRVGELRKLQHAAAERFERVAAEVDRMRAEPVGAQLEALRSSQTDAQAQLERLDGQLRRVERAEASIARLRDEVGQQLEAREQILRTEILNQSRQRRDDGDALGRELRGLASRVDTALAQQQQLDALVFQRDAMQGELQALAARVEALGADGAERGEALRRSETGLSSRILGLDARMEAVETGLSGWQARLEQQLETVREAQAIAQRMQVEAEGLRRESHAAAEAWRVAEGRVDESLASMRKDAESRWERFLGERRNDREAHARQHADELRGVREAREQAVAELEQSLEALRQELQAGLSVTGRDLDEMKHRLSSYFRNLRAQIDETAEAFDTQLPSDDPSAVDPERRQALRRALRARRSASGD